MADEFTIWTDPAGAQTVLDVEWGARGRFAPPLVETIEQVPGQPGGRWRTARHGVRSLTLPLFISAATDVALRETTRALVRAMDPARGDGSLTVVASDGEVRILTCRAVSGLELGESWPDETGVTWQRAAVTFRAADPYWYSQNGITRAYETASTPGTFLPFLPLTLASSQVFAAEALVVDGDVEAWPVWTIVGPASDVVLRNVTSGRALELSTVIEAGQIVTIDTRPGVKTIRDFAGESLWGDVSAGSSLWPLQPGINSLQVEASSTTVDTSVVLTYLPRWLTP